MSEVHNIKLIDLLKALLRPVLILLFLFVAVTAVCAYLDGVNLNRVFGINPNRVLELVDLRAESTLGSWFSSTLFLLASLGFVVLGWGTYLEYELSFMKRLAFRTAAFGMLFLSIDETAGVHETVGQFASRSFVGGSSGMLSKEVVFFWIIPFSPLFIFALGFVVWSLYALASCKQEADAPFISSKSLVVIASIALPSVLLSEALEWWISSDGGSTSALRVLEESLELIGAYALFAASVRLGKLHRL